MAAGGLTGSADEYWHAPLIDGHPRTLYHYTTLDGLSGIANSGKLWATDMDHLNDSQEFKLGAEVVLTSLKAARDRLSLGERTMPRKALYGKNSLDQVVDASPISVPKVRASFVYGVTCFCESRDLLSQWQNYGHGGFAIGFDANRVKALLRQESVRLGPVVYDPAEYLPSVEWEVDEWFRQVIASETDPNLDPDVAVRDLGILFLGLSVQIKHSGFRHEAEWRIADLVSRMDHSVAHLIKYRAGSIPYLEIDLREPGSNLMPIVEVVVGPGNDQDRRASSVEDLLQSAGYDSSSIKIERSEIPYRSR